VIREDWLDRDYIERYTLGSTAGGTGARVRSATRPAICASRRQRSKRWRATTGSCGPPSIAETTATTRHAAAAMRCVRLFRCPRWTGHWRDPAGARCFFKRHVCEDNNGLQHPELLAGRKPAHDQHEHDRRCAAAGAAADRRADRQQSNPVAVAPDSRKVAQGLRARIFLRSCWNISRPTLPTTLTTLLPATTQLEHVDVHGTYGHLFVVANHAAIEPLGEAQRIPNLPPLCSEHGFHRAVFCRKRR